MLKRSNIEFNYESDHTVETRKSLCRALKPEFNPLKNLEYENIQEFVTKNFCGVTYLLQNTPLSVRYFLAETGEQVSELPNHYKEKYLIRTQGVLNGKFFVAVYQDFAGFVLFDTRSGKIYEILFGNENIRPKALEKPSEKLF